MIKLKDNIKTEKNINLRELIKYDDQGRCINAYQLATHPEMLKVAYGKIKSNPGMMTPGVDEETLDGINLDWFEDAAKKLIKEQYTFRPSRREYIPKQNGKMRPLSISSPRDRIIQESMKLVMEFVLEPKFSNLSHGFRPGRGCHTALKEVRQWKGVNWFIEGDIKSFFDNIDHKILERLISKHFKDAQLIALFYKLVKAGYVEFKGKRHSYINSDKGVPQGGIISPLLSNLMLHELDEYAEEIMNSWNSKNVGIKRYKTNPKYHALTMRLYRLGKKTKALKSLAPSSKIRKELKGKIKNIIKERRKLTSLIPNEKSKPEIKYIRYADDWLIGIWGKKEDARTIKQMMKEKIETLNLTLSEEKTLITHARTKRAKFLGTYITKTWTKGITLAKSKDGIKRNRIPVGNIWMTAPILEIVERLRSKGFLKKDNPSRKEYQAKAITQFLVLPPSEMLTKYRSIYQGYLSYYRFVDNIYLFNKIHWILKSSLIKTLKRKYKLSNKKLIAKFGKNIVIRKMNVSGKMIIKDFKYVKPERRPMGFLIKEKGFLDPINGKLWNIRTLDSIGEKCASCGSNENIEMHHIKHIKTINPKLNKFDKMAAAINRKQIPLCKVCHQSVHRGEYHGKSLTHYQKWD